MAGAGIFFSLSIHPANAEPTWPMIRYGVDNIQYIRALAVRDQRQLFVGTDQQGTVFQLEADDSFHQWDLVPVFQPANADVVQAMLETPIGLFIALSPGKALYLYDRNGVCKPTAELGNTRDVYSLASYYFMDYHILAGTGAPEGRVYESPDGGATWLDQGSPEEGAGVFALAIGGDIGVYAGTSTGSVYYKTPLGLRDWKKLGELPEADIIHRLVFQNNGVLLAATGTKGVVYASYDYGKTWVVHGRLPDAANVMSLLQLSNGDLVAGTYPGSIMYWYRSSTGDWERDGFLEYNPDPPMFVFDLAEIIAAGPHRVIAGTGPDGGLYMGHYWLSSVPPQTDSPGSSGGDSGCFIRSLMPERER